MFNTEKPSLDELPSSQQLIRSTILAGVAALLILLVLVLPAEYGFDPTGVGRVLGLTEMGEIKQELSQEADQDDHHGSVGQSPNLLLAVLNLFVPVAHAQDVWSDELSFTLAPGEAAEIKLVMKDGDTAEYIWSAEGGRINFDLHAHGAGESVSYEKGRGKTSGEGFINAEFAGNHGWFWRNRDKNNVTITIKLRGSYSELLQE